MDDWTKVKWTEAGQLTALLGWPATDELDLATPPQDFFAELRNQGRLDEAAMFLGQALPRYEVVAWAARALDNIKPAKGSPRPENAHALAAARAWLEDPSEPSRRAAFEASNAAGEDAPERFLALAAFFSGGSMAPETCPPVPPPREAAGKFAATAILVAANQSSDRQAALLKALDQGAALANEESSSGAA
jgi:hypothetical protein